ncbi:predicted protein [Phaeodactylum tricornutum CCAP 1055/1]|uniref:BSD domain-containing protein n=1 Tax=Phaeodactylum tricornutum (strain CCAP 1055/1) TaxID=556484 RepID=B5Y4W9_PHATC|nr:predicted protein [Phaeodactylum tricornutum CCAP 1055/1]ACI65551.1 predicted protein [Phaeodactylum tricornutum CCAP 1055/1]|eukprot:XP_002186081.1 predicted protein [Phaeodactylum tricornutum CCAP 1055/1]
MTMREAMDVDSVETSYTPVRYKKQSGSLQLSTSSLTFLGEGSSKVVKWMHIAKHQVSPASYPKPLLKIVLSSGTNLTFQLPDRSALDQIRLDVTRRLQFRSSLSSSSPAGGSRKRPLTDLSQTSTFGDLDPTALAVTRSALLAAHPSLRQQHQQLVQESETLSEEDFWLTHKDLLEEEYARISGLAKAGTSSLLQSHLPTAGKVTLGVEEMRQIFILYPAVHKAYEEKVPLELSDEQFWRKYLESEYFHRDRGRMGTAAQNHSAIETKTAKSKDGVKGLSMEQQDARAAAVGTDDLFSRYDQKLSQENGENHETSHRRWGRQLAVGQFDLASTFETERGKVLEQANRDNHPPNIADDGRGTRVIQKYNRHWAMVLHPEDAIAGSDLMQVARKSVRDVLPGDDDAAAGGGFDQETRRLVKYAEASTEAANHASCLGEDEGAYEPLTLSNVEAYYSGQLRNGHTAENDEEATKRHIVLARMVSQKVGKLVDSLEKNFDLPESCFPPPSLGRELLSALTRKMAQDSRTEAASLEMVNKLPEDFRKRLHSHFRRSSELLRHFFGLRRMEAANAGNGQKLSRIVLAMESFYREMESMRRELPQTETGEMMRKMCLPIMDQLDWAFKLHREGSGGGVGGGFVAVEEI